MSNKLTQRFYEIEADITAVQQMIADKTTVEVIQERIIQLKAKQSDLTKTTLHLIALSKLRDEAWKALAYGMDA
ncbi:MAG: hypothetical protein BroJett011_22110 [Chloroflexota bacterium]|nr:MAG: hypothetical protein BroJett011_22110 [Chloroflexota bacterium]